jgi:hypothetical protein
MFINDFIDCELNHLFYVKFLDYPLVFRKSHIDVDELLLLNQILLLGVFCKENVRLKA